METVQTSRTFKSYKNSLVRVYQNCQKPLSDIQIFFKSQVANRNKSLFSMTTFLFIDQQCSDFKEEMFES